MNEPNYDELFFIQKVQHQSEFKRNEWNWQKKIMDWHEIQF